MSKNKTKYIYTIYDSEGNLITENGDFSTLKKLNLHKSVPSAFSRYKCNEVISKKYKVIRRTINDIVHPELKNSDVVK